MDRNKQVAEMIGEDWAWTIAYSCPQCGRIYADNRLRVCPICTTQMELIQALRNPLDFLHNPAAAWKLLEWCVNVKGWLVSIAQTNGMYHVMIEGNLLVAALEDTIEGALVTAVLPAEKGD